MTASRRNLLLLAASMVPFGAAAGQRGNASEGMTLAALVDSVRARAADDRENAGGREVILIADVRPTAQRGHAVFRGVGGGYVRVWARGEPDSGFAGPDSLLDALEPREAAVVYLVLDEVLRDRRSLTSLFQALARIWEYQFSNTRFTVALGFDRARFPDRYSGQQEMVLALATPDSLRQALSAPQAVHRREAVLGLRVLRDSTAVPQLASLLTDRDSTVAYAAASALLAFGNEDSERELRERERTTVPLVGALFGGETGMESVRFDAVASADTIRARAYRFLAATGEPAAPILAAHWLEGRRVRTNVTGALLSMGAAGVRELRNASRGSNQRLAEEARLALGARTRASRVVPSELAPASVERFTSVVSRVLAERTQPDELQQGGGETVAHLTAAVSALAGEDAGRVALALGELGPSAASATEAIIEAFPPEPRTAIAIPVESLPESQEGRQNLLDELRTKYGAGQLTAVRAGRFVRNRVEGPPAYFYKVEGPAAVAALFRITGVIPGVRREQWEEWVRTANRER